MLSSQLDQLDRKEVLENDKRLREQEESRRVFAQDQSLPKQATTFHQFAQADAQMPRGRFSAVDVQTVVGANPIPNYPAAAAHQRDPCGQEPPLGYRIDDLEVSFPSPQATDPTSDDAPSPRDLTDVQRAGVGSLSSQPNSASVAPPNCSEGQEQLGAGLGPLSHHAYRRF